ncbi:opine metallophore biosynthesis dehydrogenase [Paenibacillus tarimensis]
MNEQIPKANVLGNTLIVGAGPAALQVAVHLSGGWCGRIGLLNRKGSHATRLAEELKTTGNRVSAVIQSERHRHLSGDALLSRFYEGFDELDDCWETIVICTPCDSYKEVIDALRPSRLQAVRTIVLLSPGIGSNLFVNSRLGMCKDRIDVVSLSAYYAATKFAPGEQSVTSCFTKAFKKRIYISSSHKNSRSVYHFKSFIESLGIHCVVLGQPIEAESRSITTYVHPPLFMNDFSLNEIFRREKSGKSMYKLYPEGPITQHSIRSMVRLWKEISELLRFFGAKPFNLLQFLNDDNYPVHEETLSRDDIEGFELFEPIKQEYLLYIRYTSILIDPFSTPDENGKYFDFSAVPYRQVYEDQNGMWVIPRIPFEDWKRLKLLYGLAEKADIRMPETSGLLRIFERRLQAFVDGLGVQRLNPDQLSDRTEDDVRAIWLELDGLRSIS